jgi:hypothetical protein
MTSTSTTDAPVYKYNTAFVQLSKEVLDDYKEKITDQIFHESPFISLLKEKTEKAKKEMELTLNTQLYGAPKSLREIISDAYDEHMPKEAKMNEAVDKIKAEREEARAREVFDTLDAYFGDNELDADGALCTWTVQFDVDGKEYQYAAILTAGCWYVTGKDTTGRKPEDFKAYIVEKALTAHEVVFEGNVL